MPNYILKKRIIAKDMTEAIKRDKKTPVAEIWLDEKQDESPTIDAIGYNLDGDGYYYSPYMKPKKKR
jgi:hypothetical protein